MPSVDAWNSLFATVLAPLSCLHRTTPLPPAFGSEPGRTNSDRMPALHTLTSEQFTVERVRQP
jgi:hypothetical protein